MKLNYYNMLYVKKRVFKTLHMLLQEALLLKTTLTMRINSLMKLRKQAKNSHGFRIWGETGMNSISVCKVSQ